MVHPSSLLLDHEKGFQTYIDPSIAYTKSSLFVLEVSVDNGRLPSDYPQLQTVQTQHSQTPQVHDPTISPVSRGSVEAQLSAGEHVLLVPGGQAEMHEVTSDAHRIVLVTRHKVGFPHDDTT